MSPAPTSGRPARNLRRFRYISFGVISEERMSGDLFMSILCISILTSSLFLTHQLIRHKCAYISKYGHVPELDCRPLPAAGFPAHHRHRGHALHRESEKDQQRDRPSHGEVSLNGLLQSFVFVVGMLHAVDSAERSDHDFTRRQRGDQPDPDLPVESKRPDYGFHRMTDLSHDALLDGGRLSVFERQVAQYPQSNRHGEDYRARPPQENFAAIDQPQRQAAHRGPAVRWHLQHEGCRSALQYGRFK